MESTPSLKSGQAEYPTQSIHPNINGWLLPHDCHSPQSGSKQCKSGGQVHGDVEFQFIFTVNLWDHYTIICHRTRDYFLWFTTNPCPVELGAMRPVLAVAKGGLETISIAGVTLYWNIASGEDCQS